jgi:hypothetical protein
MVEALGAGRMYAVKQGEGQNRLSLDAFELIDTASENRAVMGEQLKTATPPDIRIKLSTMGDGSNARAHIRLIRNGQVVKRGLLSLPYESVWQDVLPPQRGYYRLLVEIDAHNQLVSNPIFFNSTHGPKTEVASAKTEELPAPAPPSPVDPSPPSTKVEPALAPKTEPSDPAGKYVEVTGRGVRLRKGPSTQFPVVGKADQGERLLFVRRTEVMYYSKPWIVVKKEGEFAYIWEGLVKETD